MKKLGISLLAGCTLLGVLAAPAVAGKRRSPKPAHYQPARSEKYMAWEQLRKNGRGYDVYARKIGKSGKFRVNARGTDAANGGIAGKTLVYQQWNRRGSQLFLYDLARKKRSRLGGKVNSRQWEYWPSISQNVAGDGETLLFGRRNNNGKRKIFLYDTITKKLRVLDKKARTKSGFDLAPGQVTGDYAVWHKCRGGRCDVYRYQLSTGETIRIPNFQKKEQRAASVTPEGTVYFVLASTKCGKKVLIKRWQEARGTKRLNKLPQGRDIGDTYAYAGRNGARKVLFDSFHCKKPISKIGDRADIPLRKIAVDHNGSGAGTILLSAADGDDPMECVKDCEQRFEKGTKVKLIAKPAPASRFSGWGGGCTGTDDTCLVTLVSGSSVVATFDGAPGTVSVGITGPDGSGGSVTSRPAGIDCSGGTTGCSAQMGHGTIVELTASPNAASVFDPATGWRGCDSVTAGGLCRVTISGDTDKAATAAFALKQYTLSVTRSGKGTGTVTSAAPGVDCGTDCSGIYPHGTKVALTGAAGTDSTFDPATGWSGCDAVVAGACEVAMTGDRTINASFPKEPRTLTVTKVDPVGSGTVTSNVGGIACGSDCDETYELGDTITLTAATDGNSTLAGWTGCDDPSPSGNECIVTLSEHKTVEAEFAPVDRRLTLSATNGAIDAAPAGTSCGPGCLTYHHGDEVTLTADPDDNYTFDSWGDACQGVPTTDECKVTMNGDQSASAAFALEGRSLTVVNGGNGEVSSSPAGIDCGAICSSEFPHDQVVTLKATPDDNYDFDKWTGCDSTSGGDCTIRMDGAKTIKADFVGELRALDVTLAGSGTVTSNPAGIDCGGTCSKSFPHATSVTLSASPKTGWSFTGWSGEGCSGTGTCVVQMTAARNVTATFTIKSYDLNVVSGANGSVGSSPSGIACPGDCAETLEHGTVVTLTGTPNANYNFGSWSGDCDSTNANQCTVTMNGQKSISATFTLKSYTLSVEGVGAGQGTVTSGDGGIDCGSDCSESYGHGASVTLTAASGANSVFTGWSGDCSGTGQCVVPMTQARDVTATFGLVQRELTVASNANGSFTSSPGGIDCGADCNNAYDHGTSVTITATPATGYELVSWSGCDSESSGNCSVTMTANKSVGATFQLKSYTLAVNEQPDEGGSVSRDKSGPYDHGEVVTLTATAEPGYAFDGWTGDCGTINGNECTVTMTGPDKTVTATFSISP